MDEESQQVETSTFTHLYKNAGKTIEGSQKQRREEFLKLQKEKRHNLNDEHRDFCQLLESNEEEMLYESFEDEETVLKQKKRFKFHLMMSEWFMDIPEDLSENWLAKPCPEGVRTLIIAKSHKTVCFYKNGKILFSAKSYFPGGGKSESNRVTVLDGVYNKPTKTIFILDCLCWNSMSLIESEADFRFHWLKTKFDENPDVVTWSKNHQTRLILPIVPDAMVLQENMYNLIKIDNIEVPYEGVAFYHKHSNYHFGRTPLVGWLASFMLTEKFNIDVDSRNLMKKPEGYTCFEDYIQEISNEKTKNKKRRSGGKKMDIG